MGIGTLRRLLGIAIGVISTTILAWKGFDFRLDPFFMAVLEEIEKKYEVLFSFVVPVINGAFEQLRAWFGWDLQLYPHWKHAFALLWLFFGKNSMMFASAIQPGRTAFQWFWAGVVAFVASVAAGTTPLSHANVFWWPATGLCLSVVGIRAWDAVFQGLPFGFGGAWFLLMTAMGALVATDVVYSEIPIFNSSQSPGLASLAAMIVLLALGSLWASAVDHPTRSSAYRSVGLDMLSVLGGAAAIVAVNQIL